MKIFFLIKKFPQCKVDFSFSYMGQYKNDTILYYVKIGIVIYYNFNFLEPGVFKWNEINPSLGHLCAHIG